MDTYALAKLVASVDSVDARTRLQKCVFLLQEAGCDLGAEFHLHYYGPYSRDVAEATDLLAHSDVFKETAHPHDWGERYSYRITKSGQELLQTYEGSPEGLAAKERLDPYLARFRKLNGVPLWTLELASTVAFFRTSSGATWEKAKLKTVEFKKVDRAAPVLDEAEQLAKEFVGPTA